MLLKKMTQDAGPNSYVTYRELRSLLKEAGYVYCNTVNVNDSSKNLYISNAKLIVTSEKISLNDIEFLTTDVDLYASELDGTCLDVTIVIN